MRQSGKCREIHQSIHRAHSGGNYRHIDGGINVATVISCMASSSNRGSTTAGAGLQWVGLEPLGTTTASTGGCVGGPCVAHHLGMVDRRQPPARRGRRQPPLRKNPRTDIGPSKHQRCERVEASWMRSGKCAAHTRRGVPGPGGAPRSDPRIDAGGRRREIK